MGRVAAFAPCFRQVGRDGSRSASILVNHPVEFVPGKSFRELEHDHTRFHRILIDTQLRVTPNSSHPRILPRMPHESIGLNRHPIPASRSPPSITDIDPTLSAPA